MKKLVILVYAILFAGSAYAATSMEEMEHLKKYCKADVERLCPGVPYGDGAIKKCLQKHKKEVSVGCAEALKSLKQG